jgi:hypothetical protein
VAVKKPTRKKPVKSDLEQRLKKVESRLDRLLTGKTELKVIEGADVTVAPRSKMRVVCE